MRDKVRIIGVGLLTIAALVMFGFSYFPALVALGSAPSGLPASVASSTTYITGKQNITVLSATSTNCASRIITTSSSTIKITFDDADFPSPSFGEYQGASTTVAYDSGIYGCGVVRTYGDATSTVTITITN